MRMDYYKDTDSLYIDLISSPSVESREVSPGIILDYGRDGCVVGIDIDNASHKMDLHTIELHHFPVEMQLTAS